MLIKTKDKLDYLHVVLEPRPLAIATFALFASEPPRANLDEE